MASAPGMMELWLLYPFRSRGTFNTPLPMSARVITREYLSTRPPNSNPHFQVPFACPPQSSLKAYLCTQWLLLLQPKHNFVTRPAVVPVARRVWPVPTRMQRETKWIRRDYCTQTRSYVEHRQSSRWRCITAHKTSQRQELLYLRLQLWDSRICSSCVAKRARRVRKRHGLLRSSLGGRVGGFLFVQSFSPTALAFNTAAFSYFDRVAHISRVCMRACNLPKSQLYSTVQRPSSDRPFYTALCMMIDKLRYTYAYAKPFLCVSFGFVSLFPNSFHEGKIQEK